VYSYLNDRFSDAPEFNTGDKMQYYSSLLQTLKDIVIITDPAWRIMAWNRIAEEEFGFPETSVIGIVVNDLLSFKFPGSSPELIINELESSGVWRGEILCTNNQGEIKFYLFTLSPMIEGEGVKSGILAIGKDISTQKNVQDKVYQSEKFYRGLVADSLDGILLVNEDAKIGYASPSVKFILGYDPDELDGKTAFDYVHPEDRAVAFESFQREKDQNPEIKFIVARLLKKNGEWLWCMIRGHNLFSNPFVSGIVVYFHDDTLRKNAAEALKDSEKRFRSLVSELQVGIVLQNTEGTILMGNAALYRMLSVTESEFLGKKIWEVFPDTCHEDFSWFELHERPTYACIAERKAASDVVMGVKHPRTGNYIWLLINTHPILDDDGNVQLVVGSFTDITERKKLEQKLLSEQLSHQRLLTQATIDSQEKERREIGNELHDNIGQRLTTIKLYLDLALTTADEQTAEMVILSQRNISDVINEIRSLCRTLIPSSLGDLGLVECIKDLAQTVSRAQKMQIQFNHFGFDESCLPENKKLMLFRIIQEQVNNIVKHADASKAIIRLSHEVDQLTLEITDDGNGFDVQTVKRGLGLNNMKNRTELLGGRFLIESTPGNGTVLRINISENV
jgi:PAS domain S-box-containing protein